MGYALKVAEQSPPAAPPEVRLWQAVVRHAVETLLHPEQQCRRLHRRNVELLVEQEQAYFRSPLFELHCSWAGLDPFKLRAALRKAGLL